KSTEIVDKKEKSHDLVADYFSNFDFSKLEVNIEEMFKNGAHFGHHKSRRNPKMDEYIFTTKNNINIIDLEQTKKKLEEAMKFITEVASLGQTILFVGTKKQAKKVVQLAARRCQMPFVTERWLGGTFTNSSVILDRAKYLRKEQEKLKNGEYAKYTKFEQMKKKEELERLEKKMGVIKNMKELPAAIFITSIIEDKLAVKEAKNKNIPIIALVDTNTDPSDIDYPIPANEDAISSLKLMLGYVCKAVLLGKEKKNKIVEIKETENNKEKVRAKI
ncbi:MAG TPA: 30S ribosomal protein S2, partial [Candidatus Moranbacteria bacterium]|nr:30S ribosomal protein S2 [Candidatus Moranbacteria bacterium]